MATDVFDAIEAGNISAVKAFLNDIEDINEISDDWNSSFLEAACEYGQLEIAKILLEQGADPDDGLVSTPLAIAAGNQQSELVQLLIESGANVNEVIEDGITPLICAVAAHDLKCVKILLDAGADINAEDDLGNRAYERARTVEMRAYLRSQGASTEE